MATSSTIQAYSEEECTIWPLQAKEKLHVSITEPLGAGGFGEVWAVQSLNGTDFAAKIDIGFPKFLNTVEIDTLTRIKRSNLIHALAWRETGIEGLTTSGYTLIMQLATGDLLHWVPSLSKQEKLGVIGDIWKGLRDMHEIGVVHGDLKPPNVLIFGRSKRAKLADFGFSSRKYTAENVDVGNYEYRAPIPTSMGFL